MFNSHKHGFHISTVDMTGSHHSHNRDLCLAIIHKNERALLQNASVLNVFEMLLRLIKEPPVRSLLDAKNI